MESGYLKMQILTFVDRARILSQLDTSVRQATKDINWSKPVANQECYFSSHCFCTATSYLFSFLSLSNVKYFKYAKFCFCFIVPLEETCIANVYGSYTNNVDCIRSISVKNQISEEKTSSELSNNFNKI